MRVNDKALVLQAVKYGDRKSILKLYTREHGLLSVAVVTGSSPKAKVKTSSILPCSLIEAQLIVKQNKDVQQLNEAFCYCPNENITGNFAKIGIAQFINELLIKTLKEQSSNFILFDFIEQFIKYLNECDNNLNALHVYFMLELSIYLGIEPQANFDNINCFFDNREGRFVAVHLPFPMGFDREESQLFNEAIQNNSPEKKWSKEHRIKLLDLLLAYYQMHIPGFSPPKSHIVLKEVMSEL
ncbi:MAG: DNA repair protein RecO [Sphingobacteriaceae bacterium]|nr:DNA repair protein RecO [Sphingobacteriaceae bacterium]